MPSFQAPPETPPSAPPQAPFGASAEALRQLELRDPQALLQQLQAQWQHHRQWWVFGYASLLWRPEFPFDTERPALVHGWHRALRMRSRVNRGTAQEPGLVFALLSGGACRGAVYCMQAKRAKRDLQALWEREMPTGVYDARLLTCHTPQGPVQALAFTLGRKSPAWVPHLPDAQMLHILRHATGRYGTTLDYLLQTATELSKRGIADREINRLVALARRAGLEPGSG